MERQRRFELRDDISFHSENMGHPSPRLIKPYSPDLHSRRTSNQGSVRSQRHDQLIDKMAVEREKRDLLIRELQEQNHRLREMLLAVQSQKQWQMEECQQVRNGMKSAKEQLAQAESLNAKKNQLILQLQKQIQNCQFQLLQRKAAEDRALKSALDFQNRLLKANQHLHDFKALDLSRQELLSQAREQESVERVGRERALKQVSSQRGRREQRERELQRQRVQLQQRQIQIESLKAKKLTLEQAQTRLRFSLSQLEKELDFKRNQLSLLADKNNQLAQQLHQQRTHTLQKESQLQELRTKLKETQHSNQSLSAQRDRYQNQSAQNLNLLKQQMQMRQLLQQELQQLNSQINTIESQLRLAKDQQLSSQQQFQTQTKEQSIQSQRLTQKIIGLEGEGRRKDSQIIDLEEQLRRHLSLHSRQVQQLYQTIQNAKLQHTLTSQHNFRLQSQALELQLRLKDLLRQKDQNTDLLQSVRKALVQKEVLSDQSLNAAKSQISTLQSKLLQSERKVNQLSKQNRSLSASIKCLKEGQQAGLKTIQTQSHKLQQAHLKNVQFQGKLQNLQSQKVILREEHRLAVRQKEQANLMLLKLQDEYRKLKVEQQLTLDQLTCEQINRKTLQSEIKATQTKLQAQQTHNQSLRHEAQTKERVCQSHLFQLQQKQLRIQRLNQTVKSNEIRLAQGDSRYKQILQSHQKSTLDFEASKAKLSQELVSTKQQLEKVGLELITLKDQNASARAQNSVLRQYLQKSQKNLANMATLESKRASLQLQLSTKTLQIKALQDQLYKANSAAIQLNKLQHQRSDLIAKHEQLNRDITSLQRQLASLRHVLSQRDQMMLRQGQLCKQLQLKIQFYQHRKMDAESRLNETAVQLSNQLKTHQSEKRRGLQQEQFILELTDTLSDKQAKLQQLQSACNSGRERLQQTEKELSCAREQLQYQRRRNGHLQQLYGKYRSMRSVREG